MKNRNEITGGLIQDLPFAIYACDSNGFITHYNKAAVILWGRTPEIGKDIWCGSFKIFQLDGTPQPLNTCPMAIAIKEGREVYGHELIIERPDGSRRHVKPYPSPLFDADGKITGAVNMIEDITDQRLASQYVRSLIEASLDPLITINTEGKIMDMNEAMIEITGTSREKLKADETYEDLLEKQRKSKSTSKI